MFLPEGYSAPDINLEVIERLARTSTYYPDEILDKIDLVDMDDLIKFLKENQQIPGLHYTPHTVHEQGIAIRYQVEKDDYNESRRKTK